MLRLAPPWVSDRRTLYIVFVVLIQLHNTKAVPPVSLPTYSPPLPHASLPWAVSLFLGLSKQASS